MFVCLISVKLVVVCPVRVEISFQVPVSRCTIIADWPSLLFNNYPRFQYTTAAVESRICALKPRTNFSLNFVRDLDAKVWSTVKANASAGVFGVSGPQQINKRLCTRAFGNGMQNGNALSEMLRQFLKASLVQGVQSDTVCTGYVN